MSTCGCRTLTPEEIDAIRHEITPIERIRKHNLNDYNRITSEPDTTFVPRRNENRDAPIGRSK